MLPEVEAYYADRKAAADKYDQAIVSDDSYDIYQNDMRAAKRHLRDSDNPIISWIGNHQNALDYSEADTFLKAFPLTYEQMERMSQRERWCGVWTRLRDEAIAAGVIEREFNLQYQTPTGRWRAFRNVVHTSAGHAITKEFVNKIFTLGNVTSVTLDIDAQHYKFQIDPTREPSEVF